MTAISRSIIQFLVTNRKNKTNNNKRIYECDQNIKQKGGGNPCFQALTKNTLHNHWLFSFKLRYHDQQVVGAEI